MRFWNTLKLHSRKSNSSNNHGNDPEVYHESFVEIDKAIDPERHSRAIEPPLKLLKQNAQQAYGLSDALGLTRTLTETTITMDDDSGIESDKEDHDVFRLSARNLEGASRIPFSAVQQAIITAQLSSLISTTSPQVMNYYQRKVARFQPQIVVPNNSPTTSAKHRAFQKSNSPTSTKPGHQHYFKQNFGTPSENSESSAGTPRTPWNSPLSVAPLTHSNSFHSPGSITLAGTTNSMRIHTAPNPTKFNHYQNKFQSNTQQSYTVTQSNIEKSCSDDSCEPFSPLRTESLKDEQGEGFEYEAKESITDQYVHSTATPYNSPFISAATSITEECQLDSLKELLCAETGKLSEQQQLEGNVCLPCPVRSAECKHCLETMKERMIAQYLHSPATPYYSPIQALHQSGISFDANEIFELSSSPRL